MFKIGEYLAKLQAEHGSLMHFVRLANTMLKMKKVHETITLLLVTLPDIYRLKKRTVRSAAHWRSRVTMSCDF